MGISNYNKLITSLHMLNIYMGKLQVIKSITYLHIDFITIKPVFEYKYRRHLFFINIQIYYTLTANDTFIIG